MASASARSRDRFLEAIKEWSLNELCIFYKKHFRLVPLSKETRWVEKEIERRCESSVYKLYLEKKELFSP